MSPLGSGPGGGLSSKTLLVHYWLVNRRGGEAVLEAIGRLFPDADLLTNVVRPEIPYGSLATMPLKTTFIDGLPFARQAHPLYMPLMPLALEAVDTELYDLIISSEAGPAKWVLPRPDAIHVCYCHCRCDMSGIRGMAICARFPRHCGRWAIWRGEACVMQTFCPVFVSPSSSPTRLSSRVGSSSTIGATARSFTPRWTLRHSQPVSLRISICQRVRWCPTSAPSWRSRP